MSLKKRILFIVTYLNTGGIIRALQNLLNCYDTTKYEIDVFAMVHQGAFRGNLCNCCVLSPHLWVEASVAHLEDQHGVAKVRSFFLKMLDKSTNYRFRKRLFTSVGKKIIKENHYDAVIGFSEGLPTLMVSMMNHPNRIGWVHCDYSSYLRAGKGRSELEVYKQLQSIVCVSEFTRDSFISIYPSLALQTHAIYNIIDDKMMRAKASEKIADSFDSVFFNIVSVGRIDPVKRLSIVPELAREVVDSGCKIRWYVIGPKGTDDEQQRLFCNLSRFGMEGVVIPLGEKTNPYPYIAKADLLVNTSYSEACPYVINEAKILGTPVVCTDFGSAKEFIDYGKNGYYEPIEKLSYRIVDLIKNRGKLENLAKNLEGFTYDNRKILDGLYSLIGS